MSKYRILMPTYVEDWVEANEGGGVFEQDPILLDLVKSAWDRMFYQYHYTGPNPLPFPDTFDGQNNTQLRDTLRGYFEGNLSFMFDFNEFGTVENLDGYDTSLVPNLNTVPSSANLLYWRYDKTTSQLRTISEKFDAYVSHVFSATGFVVNLDYLELQNYSNPTTADLQAIYLVLKHCFTHQINQVYTHDCVRMDLKDVSSSGSDADEVTAYNEFVSNISNTWYQTTTFDYCEVRCDSTQNELGSTYSTDIDRGGLRLWFNRSETFNGAEDALGNFTYPPAIDYKYSLMYNASYIPERPLQLDWPLNTVRSKSLVEDGTYLQTDGQTSLHTTVLDLQANDLTNFLNRTVSESNVKSRSSAVYLIFKIDTDALLLYSSNYLVTNWPILQP
jgi:hypothetical protein